MRWHAERGVAVNLTYRTCRIPCDCIYEEWYPFFVNSITKKPPTTPASRYSCEAPGGFFFWPLDGCALCLLAPRSPAALGLFLGRDEPHGSFGWVWRCHQLAQRVKRLFELDPGMAAEGVMLHCQGVGLVFQFGLALGQFLVGGGCGAHLYIGPHDFDVDGDGAWAVQDRRQHGHTLLGESVRRIAATTMART